MASQGQGDSIGSGGSRILKRDYRKRNRSSTLCSIPPIPDRAELRTHGGDRLASLGIGVPVDQVTRVAAAAPVIVDNAALEPIIYEDGI